MRRALDAPREVGGREDPTEQDELEDEELRLPVELGRLDEDAPREEEGLEPQAPEHGAPRADEQGRERDDREEREERGHAARPWTRTVTASERSAAPSATSV